MPVDLTNPTGFNQYWEDTVGQFRQEAIDGPMDGGPLADVEAHITGAVDQNTLQAQFAFPFVWSQPLNHSPAYQTINTDQGTLSMRVVTFARDEDPDMALTKARVIGGRIVNAVEGSSLVDSDGTAHASKVLLNDFQLDSRPVADQGAQVKFAELQFGIDVERRY